MMKQQRKDDTNAKLTRLAVDGKWQEVLQVARQLAADLDVAEEERDERQRFKDWVHAYLDQHGVPHHPPGTHGAAGCRIGDRMDWLMAKLAASEQRVEGMRKALEPCNRCDYDEATGCLVSHCKGCQLRICQAAWEAFVVGTAALAGQPEAGERKENA